MRCLQHRVPLGSDVKTWDTKKEPFPRKSPNRVHGVWRLTSVRSNFRVSKQAHHFFSPCQLVFTGYRANRVAVYSLQSLFHVSIIFFYSCILNRVILRFWDNDWHILNCIVNRKLICLTTMNSSLDGLDWVETRCVSWRDANPNVSNHMSCIIY